MAELATIARPYAEAVFALADKAGTLADWSRMLGAMADAAGNAEVRSLLTNPNVKTAELVDLFLAVSKDALTPEAKSFVQTLAENRRIAVLPQLRDLYEELKNERESTVEAHVASAFEIGQAELATLVADLEKRFKRKVQPAVTIDKDLIGGVRIEVGDEVIDGSVRGKLNAMARLRQLHSQIFCNRSHV